MGPRWVGGVTAGAGLCLLGILVAAAAGPQSATPGVASILSSEDPGWTAAISWTGQIASQVCAPNGLQSCAGARFGDQDDLHIMPVERSPSKIDLRVEWDGAATGARELSVALDGVVVRKGDCQDCQSYRFRVLTKATGTSPLTLSVSDVELGPGEELAILVRVPDGLPQPVMASAWTSQPFVVTGSMGSD